MADNEDAKPKTAAPVTVSITLGSVETGEIELTNEQVRRLLANLGNQVVTWLRHDVKDSRDIPVVCNEGVQGWSSEDDECRSNEDV
jgi:hypothetical protein